MDQLTEEFIAKWTAQTEPFAVKAELARDPRQGKNVGVYLELDSHFLSKQVIHPNNINVVSALSPPKRIIVDYGSPNMAKGTYIIKLSSNRQNYMLDICVRWLLVNL